MTKEKILHKLEELIQNKHDEKEAKILIAFMRFYFNMVSVEDLLNKSISDLYSLLLSHWDLLKLYIAKKSSGIRLYNPSFKESGWESQNTILEIIHDDMPFIIDSIRNEIVNLGLDAEVIFSPGALWFDIKGEDILSVQKYSKEEKGRRIAVIYIEINKVTDEELLKNILTSLENTLYDIKIIVEDWQKMRNLALESAKSLSKVDSETHDFLNWLSNDNFTFLGACDYSIDKDNNLHFIEKSGLGFLSEDKSRTFAQDIKYLPRESCALHNPDNVIAIGKMERRSTVHRRAYMDYVGVKLFSKKNKCIGERRFIGLYTYRAYNADPMEIPLLRGKMQNILSRSTLLSDSNAGKNLINILSTFPRDDLFQATEEELYSTVMGVMQIQERPILRVFIRKDQYGRYCSCLVFVPRDIFGSSLRQKIGNILKERLNGEEINFSTRFSESILARTHFNVRVKEGEAISEFNTKEIENEIIEATKTWTDNLEINLLKSYDEEKAEKISRQLLGAFPDAYQLRYSPEAALHDIKIIKDIDSNNPLRTTVYSKSKNSNSWIFKLFRLNEGLILTDILPILENLGMLVIGENSFELCLNDGNKIWLHEFEVKPLSADVDLKDVRDNFQSCFYNVWYENAGNDYFNRLILAANLTWREIVILRSYAKYFKQIGFNLSEQYIQTTLINNIDVVKELIKLFMVRLSPFVIKGDSAEEIEDSINKYLDSIQNIDEDRILRQYLSVIKATLRTNYFQKESSGQSKPYVSFKLKSDEIIGVPKPVPMYEVFVYSPQVEGVHLRSGKVARGGLRWSDRREDYRTEVLGLMKAQQVKNAVIVPSGAKGGFVVKKIPEKCSNEERMEIVINCYSMFIRGLLDITDNLIEDLVVAPENVKRLDGDDYYLVVAADKGTATFSDIANKIAQEYNFWLGDAFASGGSAGYDHKKMGITARGAWESVKRHFHELDKDIQKEDFTAIGIGDMSGDVFGNGMLLSKHIRLVAAFNHMHIFIDPNPDAAISFEERERLFNLPRSSWTDYDLNLISAGGGVFSRSSKYITVTDEMKEIFGINKSLIQPNELIRLLLQADVDLLWNGGIGTYVKAQEENNLQVGDRSNDAIRINGKQLHCKVVGEGGNLGLTQLGRIEAALNGVKLFTDFIDNSAGVDCSDHEVNIKILLNSAIKSGKIDNDARNELLASMTDNVAELVLRNNYEQGQAISFATMRSPLTVEEYSRFMLQLKKAGQLDIKIEYLPDSSKVEERRSNQLGFVGPEIAILLSYSKNLLTAELLQFDLLNNDILIKYLEKEFPSEIIDKYYDEMLNHSLRKEIVATQLSNQIINRMGITYVKRLYDETGASTADIVSAHLIADKVFEFDALWKQIENLSGVETAVQYSIMFDLVRLVRRSTRWFLRNGRENLDVNGNIDKFKDNLQNLWTSLEQLLPENEVEKLVELREKYREANIPDEIINKIITIRPLYSALDIIEIAIGNNLDVNFVAKSYYALGSCLSLAEFREKLSSNPVDDNWDALARAGIRDDIDYYQREIVLGFLKNNEITEIDSVEIIEKWLENFSSLVIRWRSILADLRGSKSQEFTIFAVAVRELMDLAQISRQ